MNCHFMNYTAQESVIECTSSCLQLYVDRDTREILVNKLRIKENNIEQWKN